MFKCGDKVQSLKTGIIYECLGDQIDSEPITIQCIDNSLMDKNRFHISVGEILQVNIESLVSYTFTMPKAEETQALEAESLTEQRRALKSFLGQI